MNKRITVRIDEGITQQLSNIDIGRIINLSALVREALMEKLNALISIDNSSQCSSLEKGKVNNEIISFPTERFRFLY